MTQRYCEPHNCMFGGVRLKQLAWLQITKHSWPRIVCEQVIMSMHRECKVGDTARAECTPQPAKALATAKCLPGFEAT